MNEINPELLNDCEKEPLANSGLIQPHGALLFLDRRTGQFIYASANSQAFLEESPEQLLGADGHGWLAEMLPDLGTLPVGAGNRRYLERALDLGNGELDVLVSPIASGWFLEFEPADSGLASDDGASRSPDAEPAPPAGQGDLERSYQAVVDGVSALTGYDRVMLYQFLPDWSGEVLAERVLRSEGTYLSLRFPASDIPAIARSLYAQSPYRYIPSATNDTVAVFGREGTGEALDLTWSDLRSVSPVHIQYLANMQVRASFSLSIMLEGRLWGLLACHNDGPGPISLKARLGCLDQVTQFAEGLQARRVAQQKRIADALASAVDEGLADEGSPAGLAEALTGVLGRLEGLVEFSGGAVDVAGETRCFGVPLAPEPARALMAAGMHATFDSIDAQESLPDAFPGRDACHGAGVFGYSCFRLRAARLGNALVSLALFRPEEAGEVAWAGNPEKPVEVTGTGSLRLSPRESFEKWTQVREGLGRVWTEDELFALSFLRRQLDDVLG